MYTEIILANSSKPVRIEQQWAKGSAEGQSHSADTGTAEKEGNGGGMDLVGTNAEKGITTRESFCDPKRPGNGGQGGQHAGGGNAGRDNAPAVMEGDDKTRKIAKEEADRDEMPRVVKACEIEDAHHPMSDKDTHDQADCNVQPAVEAPNATKSDISPPACTGETIVEGQDEVVPETPEPSRSRDLSNDATITVAESSAKHSPSKVQSGCDTDDLDGRRGFTLPRRLLDPVGFGCLQGAS